MARPGPLSQESNFEPSLDNRGSRVRPRPCSRRAFGGFAVRGSRPATRNAEKRTPAPAGRLKQSVCRWPYHSIKLDELCHRVKQMGLAGIDLLYADEWHVARDAGLTVSMGYPSRRENFIQTGFNNPANHTLLLNELETALPLARSAPAYRT